jgi:uncharacterized lipoprotein YmbA
MMRTAFVVLVLLAIALLLGGCATPKPQVITQIKIERVRVPPALLVVAPMPIVPQGAVTQATVAAYLTRLWVDDFNRRADQLAIAKIEAQPLASQSSSQGK